MPDNIPICYLTLLLHLSYHHLKCIFMKTKSQDILSPIVKPNYRDNNVRQAFFLDALDDIKEIVEYNSVKYLMKR
jgi:hypothetical protein